MKNYYTYVTVSGENVLLIYQMAPETGVLTLLDKVTIANAPGPLAVDPTQRFLYVGQRANHQCAAYQIDPSTGKITPHGKPIQLDADPCYTATDQRGRFLMATSYSGARVMVHPIDAGGTLVAEPVVSISTAPCAHCIETDRSNRFAFVPHIAGPNLIFQFHFDQETGLLTPNMRPTVVPPPGEGPRHYVYHPELDILYFSNEQGGSVTAYHFDTGAGTLAPFQTLPTLPADFEGENTCAQIHIHPTGRFLYVSNRGHDSIACYALDPSNGQMTALGQQLTEPVPRVFHIDPTGQYMYVAGQGSGKMAAYRIDSQTGLLEHQAQYDVGKQPMWVMVLGFDS